MRVLTRRTLPSIVMAACLTCAPAQTRAQGGPGPNSLYQMQRMAARGTWFVVTTDSGRFMSRIARIDRAGLSGFTVNEGPARSEPLAWTQLHRVDEVVTRATGYGRLGGLVLGLSCAGLGNALGAPTQKGGAYAMFGLGAGWALGFNLGRRYGERVRLADRMWFPTSDRDTLPADTMAAPLAELASANVLRACERITPDRKVRVSGSFGEFTGYAGLAGPDGLARLEPSTRKASAPERIAWSDIDVVEVRGGSALASAAAGGLSFGLLGACLGAAAVSVAQSDVGAGTAAIQGFFYVAPVGAVLGALVGSAARHWVVLYRR